MPESVRASGARRHAAVRPSTRDRGASAWVGWIAFAGLLMIMLGTFHVLQGIVALVREEYFLVARRDLLVDVGYTAWGWAHLVGGVVVVVAGVCVFAGQRWARAVGTVLAAASAVLSMAFLATYPVWGLLMVALAVVVILALTVHGSDIRPGG